MRPMLAVVAALALAGCAPVMFQHPTKGQEDFRIDYGQCRAFALQGYGSQTNPFVAREVMIACLEGKGWYQAQQPQAAAAASSPTNDSTRESP